MSRPYLEVKVVKMKKCQHGLAKWTPGNIYKCCKCGNIVTEKTHKSIDPRELEGNWVNGENLDKIKFPCFCSYKDLEGKLHYGELDFIYCLGNVFYRLRKLIQSEAGITIRYEHTDSDLPTLIKAYDIHILKGKIILFEEE